MIQLYFENHHIDCIGRCENKYTLYVADKNDPELKVIGYIQYTILEDINTFDNNNELYIDYVEVIEEFRGKGVGKALYLKLFELNNDMTFMRAGYYSESGRSIRKWFEEEVLNKYAKQLTIK